MSHTSEDTIFALSSGAGRSAIAVIRVSGPQVRSVLEDMTGSVPKPRYARLCQIRHPLGRHVLDQGLVLFFPGPRSETGEDIAELQVHGGHAVVAATLSALSSISGCRPAEPGEFAHRALRHGKMDLLDVESLADLLDAQTELQRRQAVEGGGIILRQRVDRWRETLLDILADLEARIDFSDEADVTDHIDSQSERLIENLIADMTLVLSEGNRGERLRDGYRVALLGAPNAGKSSLLNALAKRDVAIVSSQPGTTRDRIEVPLDLRGTPIIVTDTAGLQETADQIEQEGIRRSLGAARTADLVLWLCAVDQPSFPPPDLGQSNVKLVLTKTDKARISTCPAIDSWCGISVVSGAGIERLIRQLELEAGQAFGAGEPALLTRLRHIHAIEHARSSLQRIARLSAIELISEEIRLSCRALEQLLGRIDVEDVLGVIFSRFCIGK